MDKKFDRDYCILLLRDESAKLLARDISRFPQRSDFSQDEITAIKAYLGPWPRALEAAGLKEADVEKAAKKERERVAAKRRKTQTKINAKK